MDIDEAMEKFGNSFRDAKRGPQAQAELFNMYGAALARAEAAEKRVAELEEGVKAIDNAVAIQCSDGNWNYDPYMHGMANGLLLAQTYMAHPTGAYDAEHYKPLSAPERWLSDVAPTPPPAATE